ncbi:helix-turn-helix domain-containing protein [Actinokineospora soli]|uniref:Helix-turn-helix domain-containing protein n=1 Tax=Actinokineospora soli TaxID=1048753 RepID=A0ABW2TSN6_9PSEU
MTTQTSARRRELGDELRRARERSGLTAAQLADQLGWQPSKLSRVERGLNRCTEVEAAMLLGYLRAEPDEVRRILALCDDEERGSWLQAFGNRLPDQLRTLILSESTACAIASVELNRIPGLLQTECYTRAMLCEAGLVPSAGVEPRVEARQARQALLHRSNPPNFVFYIHEQALGLQIGGPAVMHEQMLYLVFAASQPGCVIRIIPTAAGAHAALDGPFRLMSFAEHHPVVYLETQNRSLVLEKPLDIASYKLVLAKLADQALSATESRSMLVDYASRYDVMEAAASDDSGDQVAEEQLQRH